jgi:hypothetical protein
MLSNALSLVDFVLTLVTTASLPFTVQTILIFSTYILDYPMSLLRRIAPDLQTGRICSLISRYQSFKSNHRHTHHTVEGRVAKNEDRIHQYYFATRRSRL